MRHNASLVNTEVAFYPHYNWRLSYLVWGLASFGLLERLKYGLGYLLNNITIRLPPNAMEITPSLILNDLPDMIFGKLNWYR